MSSHTGSSSDHQRRRVRLRIRDDDDDEVYQPSSHRKRHNSFVRLSSEVARDLQNLILSSSSDVLSGVETDPDSCWVLLDEQEATSSPSVDFLPLEITLQCNDDDDTAEHTTLYASFNGGTIDCDDDIGTIEIPRSLLPTDMARSNAPSFVSIQAFSYIEYGARVEVEPLTTEDWELLEIHSEAIEQGELLNQVSVVYPNQIVSFRVGSHGDKVMVLVKDVKTASSLTSDSTIWPDLVDVEGRCNLTPIPRCVLLVQNTEVVVVPKPRSVKKTVSWTPPLRLIPSEAEWGSALGVLKSIAAVKTFFVEACSVVVNAKQWSYDSEWSRVKPEQTKSPERLVRVLLSSDVPLGHAVLHPGTRLDMKLLDFRDSIQLKPFTPKVVAPEAIRLERVHLTNGSRKNLGSWNVPEISLSTGIMSTFPAAHSSDERRSITVPVGALVPSYVFATEAGPEDGSEWLRLVPTNHGQNSTRYVVSLNRSSLDVQWTSRAVLHPDVAVSIRGPREHVGSSDWIVPVTERMKRFSSVVVKLFGSTGSGKSHAAVLLAAFASIRLHRPIFYLNCKKLQKTSPKMAGILGEVDAVFRQAQEMQGAVIVLDDFDSLSPNLLDNGESKSSAKMHSANPAAVDQSKIIADRILHNFETLSERNGVSLVVTCAGLDSINPVLFRSLKVPIVPLEVPVLPPEAQVDLLWNFINRQSPNLSVAARLPLLSERLSGFLPRDLEKLSLRASRLFQTSTTVKSIKEVLLDVLDDFTPLAQMQASNRSRSDRTLGWDDLGGLFEVKEKLDAVVRRPIVFRKIYEKAKIRLPRGILLFGPPGCGKSCIVPALAQACNYPIVTVRGPEIFDKYIGASEAKVREMFERATQMAPSILFLDELEALAPRRGSDSTGVTDRVVNQLLTFLDGVEDASMGTVYIVGATSRPDKVDPAIVRPGRLERHFYLGPPETVEEWTDLLVRVSNQWNLSADCSSVLSDDALLQMIGGMPRLSPADVRAAFDTAHLHAVHRKLAETLASEIVTVEIESEDLLFGFQETRPSLNEMEAKTLNAVYRPFRGKRSGYAKDNSQGDVASPLRTTFR